MPLHQNLLKQARKGVLTGVVVGSPVALVSRKGVATKGVRDGILLLHK
jgi:hypothetical protein